MKQPLLSRAHRLPRRLGIPTFLLVLLSLLSLGIFLAGPVRGQLLQAPAAAAAAGTPLIQQPIQKAALIELSGPVDDVMLSSIKRRVDLARKENCTLLIMDLDTNGGLLTSALDISRYIKSLDMPTVAWVNTKAYSAGAVIALACRYRIMASTGQMGDAMPIQVAMGEARAIPDDLKAKARSPMLSELADSAEKNGFDEHLAWAMVVPEMTVYEVRNTITGEVRYVADDVTKQKLLDEQTPPNAEGHSVRPWRLTEPPVDGPKTLLTVGATSALAMGLASREADSIEQLRAACNVRGELVALDYSWSELLVRWLTQVPVRFGLFVIMLVLGYVELSHPGISIAGIGAVICLLLLVGAPYLTGLAQIWEILFIVVGLAIIVGDLFFVGTMGLLAVPGFILLAIGLVASFVPLGNSWGSWRDGLLHGTTVLVVGSIVSIVAFWVLSKFLYLTPGFRHLQLQARVLPVAAGSGVVDATDAPAADVVFVGALGQAVSDLRPAGKARFDIQLIDVVTEGQYVPVGTAVEVREIQGSRVVVRPHAAGSITPKPAQGTA